LLPNSRTEGARVVYLSKGIPRTECVAASIYQRFSFLDGGLDLGQLLLLLFCGDPTESDQNNPQKRGLPNEHEGLPNEHEGESD
jgi:hypothetical protein